jgi:hypothetical protein
MKNYTCVEITLRVKSHSAGENCNLRIEITLVRVEITLVRYLITPISDNTNYIWFKYNKILI